MPVFVCHRHLMYNFLDVLVSRFNNTIHLRSVGRRVVMLYLELFTELSDHCVVEIHIIVSNNYLWHTIPTDQVMPNKSRHNVLGHSRKKRPSQPIL